MKKLKLHKLNDTKLRIYTYVGNRNMVLLVDSSVVNHDIRGNSILSGCLINANTLDINGLSGHSDRWESKYFVEQKSVEIDVTNLIGNDLLIINTNKYSIPRIFVKGTQGCKNCVIYPRDGVMYYDYLLF